jgi:hypothetical protein
MSELDLGNVAGSWFLRGYRNYTGKSALRAARKMGGRTGAICSFRYPPTTARGLAPTLEWESPSVDFGGVISRRLSFGTPGPWAIEVEAGLYPVSVIAGGGALLVSGRFQVVLGRITIVSVFPAVTTVLPPSDSAKMYRVHGAIECGLYEPKSRKNEPCPCPE